MSRSLVGWVTLLLLAPASPAAVPAADWPAGPGDAVFGPAKVVPFHLTMTDKQFAALNPPLRGPFGPPPGLGPPQNPTGDTHRNTFGIDFPWSRGDLLFAGETFQDVGVRYKGNYTFTATARSLKKSLKIDLNRHADGQKLDGLTMLNFHCNASDASRAREALAYAVCRDAGVPAPRTAFAELTLTVPGRYDKELVGVYTLVEQVNKGFLKAHFRDGKGMLLKPEGLTGGLPHLGPNWTPYEDRYRPEGTPTDQQKQRLIDFTRLIDRGTDEQFAREVGSFLDVDAFLRFIAANVLLANLDSYLAFGHNYFLYLVPSTGKFVFIPWDLDLSLAAWPAAGPPEQQVLLSIHHPHAGRNNLLDRLFTVREHKDRYLAILKDLTAKTFTRKGLHARLDAIEGALREPLAREAKAAAARKEDRAPGGFGPGFGPPGMAAGQFGGSLPPRQFIDRRTASVAAQLAGESKGFEPRPFGFGFGPPPGPPGPGPFPPGPFPPGAVPPGPEKRDR